MLAEIKCNKKNDLKEIVFLLKEMHLGINVRVKGKDQSKDAVLMGRKKTEDGRGNGRC